MSSLLIAGGLTLFIIFLIKYIKSFESYNDGDAFGYDFDPDSMVIFVLGLFVTILGTNSLVAYFVKRFSYLRMSTALSAIVSASLVYAIARLIRMYVKEKDPTTYWIWFIVGLLTVLIVGVFFTISLIKYRRDKSVSDSANQLDLSHDVSDIH